MDLINTINAMSTDELIEFETNHINRLIEGISKTKELCSPKGRTSIHEYGFKGNANEVIKQLRYLRLKLYMTQDISKDEVIKRKEAMLLYEKVKYQSHDSQSIALIVKELRENGVTELNSIDSNRIANALTDSIMMDRILHDTKQCECYNN